MSEKETFAAVGCLWSIIGLFIHLPLWQRCDRDVQKGE
jgi:hypothetical protein